MTGTAKHRSRSYGYFAIAATVYVIGSVCFSTWSYSIQRELLLEHADESLILAARTAREVIGTGRAREHILSGSTNAPVYAQHQLRLEHFSETCGFMALDIAVRNTNSTFYLMSGSGVAGVVPENRIHHGDPLPKKLYRTLMQLAMHETKDIAMLTTDHAEYGALQTAMIYEPDTPKFGYAFMATRQVDELDRILKQLAVKKIVEGFFLLGMVIPLIVLYSRAHQHSAVKLEQLNIQLNQEVGLQKQREGELKAAIHDLERFNAVSSGRESRILELKNEVNDLLEQLSQHRRYNTDYEDQ